MIYFLNVANHSLFFYYLASNFAYLAMLIIALRTSATHLRHLKSIDLNWIKGSALVPPVAVLVPAHNEEKSICTAVRNLLDLDYPELELIVVNDGSTDNTLQRMQKEFRLRLVRAVYVPQVTCAPVRGLYRSDVDLRLLVVDKEPAGSKADAINAGLNAAASPYVCVVDADSILERDALLRLMVPILADPKRVVAAGGIVRVLNGSEIEEGRIRRVRLPRKSIEVIQVVEYLRAFLIGREAWARGNMLMIVSGCLGRAPTTASTLSRTRCAGRKYHRICVRSRDSGRAGIKVCWTSCGQTGTCCSARAMAALDGWRFPTCGSSNSSRLSSKSPASRRFYWR